MCMMRMYRGISACQCQQRDYDGRRDRAVDEVARDEGDRSPDRNPYGRNG